MSNLAGFSELPHTADVCIRIWGPDINSLFVQGAQGLFYLVQPEGISDTSIDIPIKIEGGDLETLLVGFLSLLLYWLEVDKLICSNPNIKYENGKITGSITCHYCEMISRQIKAVTFHDLNIRETSNGYVAEIVFDV